MSDVSMKLLLVDDDDDFRRSSMKYVERKGHIVQGASSGAEAMAILERETFDVAVFDIDMPSMSGLELMQRVQEAKMDLEVIFLTGHGSIETAVAAMKFGAFDYLKKPCSLSELEHHCLLACDRNRLRKENSQLKAIVARATPKQRLVGNSEAIKSVLRFVEKMAHTTKPVLIEGESGTGKEVVARLIQQQSEIADKPFITINCAALPDHLVESELFGHVKGAFTGATAEKPGLFEIADGGTLFIDEIGELPLTLQPKFLRVLEDGTLRRVGCHRERRVKVRIITATNRDLSREVKEGNFREDLFHRINVLSLKLPPLRDRDGDVERLIDHLLPKGFSLDNEAREAMVKYAWPGNVRQLINVIDRATILSDQLEITLDDLPEELTAQDEVSSAYAVEAQTQNERPVSINHPAKADDTTTLLESKNVKLYDLVKAHVLRVLAHENGNKARAARELGIHRRKLYRLLELYEKGSISSHVDVVLPKGSP